MGGLPFTELIRQIVFDTFPIKWTEDLTGPRLDAWAMVCAMAEKLRRCEKKYEEYGKTLQCIVEQNLKCEKHESYSAFNQEFMASIILRRPCLNYSN